MKNTLTWEDVIKRDDIIDGNIMFYEVNNVYRGQIRSIKIDAEKILIHTLKTERALTTDDNEKKRWEHSHITYFSLDKRIAPNQISDGCVSFLIPPLSFGIFYPKGFKFDVAEVKRLKT